jgi:hypothetical protein
LTIPTYLGHEAAKNSLSAPAIRLYAVAFGINDAWLRQGNMPSGLGSQLDSHLKSIKDPEDVLPFRHLVSPFRPPDKPVLAKLKAALRVQQIPKWAANSGDVLREIDLHDLRKHGLDALHSKPSKFWPLPKGFVRRAFYASLNDVVAVVCDGSTERLFVDIAQTKLDDEGKFLVLRSNEVMQLDMADGLPLPEGAHVVGRIQARFILSNRNSA